MTYAIAGVNQDQDGRSDMAAQVTADRPTAPVTVYEPDGAQKRPNRDVVIQIMLTGFWCRCHGDRRSCVRMAALYLPSGQLLSLVRPS